MDGRSLVLIILAATCVGWPASAHGATQSDYTVPAREQLFTGTLSGLAAAYQTLTAGVNDQSVAGDRRELLLLHVVARTGMLVFDRGNVAVNTSVLEIAQPFGVTVTGDKLSPVDPCDPDRVIVHWPVDPNDPNCLQIPPGADVDAAVGAVNTAILPQLDAILAELAQVTNSPAFAMTLTPTETGLLSSTEVDYGDVLALKAGLLAGKALLYSGANPGHDLSVDLNNPIFAGWQCGTLPESTTANTILDLYQNLLEFLPTTGSSRLAQAKQNLIAALNAGITTLDHIMAETDDQTDDLLLMEAEDRAQNTAVRADLVKFRDSLVNRTSATYTVESKQTYALKQSGQTVGRLRLTYAGPACLEEEGGWLEFSSPGDLPAWWDIDWFGAHGGTVEGSAEGMTNEGYWWGWFDGTISADGSQITNLTFEYWDWWSWDAISGLSAQRTDNDLSTAQFNPNPLFAGTANPRDMLPQFDPNGGTIPGTIGYGLNNDATLGGVFPGMTQQDWMPWGFEVWAGNVDLRSEPGQWTIFYNIDQHGYTKLGESAGHTLTVTGNYQYYVIAARGEFLLDSIQGSDGSFYNGTLTTGNTPTWWNITGATDGQYTTVGEDRFLDWGHDSFSGYVVIANPGGWTGLTVVTDAGPSELHDWNGDGIVSIIGDVPPFVNCVYFGAPPAGVDPVAAGDCNHDGIISIVGDVPCFVDCVYFQDCPQ